MLFKLFKCALVLGAVCLMSARVSATDPEFEFYGSFGGNTYLQSTAVAADIELWPYSDTKVDRDPDTGYCTRSGQWLLETDSGTAQLGLIQYARSRQQVGVINSATSGLAKTRIYSTINLNALHLAGVGSAAITSTHTTGHVEYEGECTADGWEDYDYFNVDFDFKFKSPTPTYDDLGYCHQLVRIECGPEGYVTDIKAEWCNDDLDSYEEWHVTGVLWNYDGILDSWTSTYVSWYGDDEDWSDLENWDGGEDVTMGGDPDDYAGELYFKLTLDPVYPLTMSVHGGVGQKQQLSHSSNGGLEGIIEQTSSQWIAWK